MLCWSALAATTANLLHKLKFSRGEIQNNGTKAQNQNLYAEECVIFTLLVLLFEMCYFQN